MFNPMMIGYARVSTHDQNLDLQINALTKAGCQKIYEEKASRVRTESPGSAKTMEMLREDDTLVVWEFERLGRSVKQLDDIVGKMYKAGYPF